MTTYEPGTVAVATVRGVPNVRVIHDDRKPAWVSGATIDGFQWHSGVDQVTDVRPLVVLDLDDPNLVGCSAVTPIPDGVVAALMDTNSAAAHAIARQIEAQTKPPRIPEPGLWGVVEAKTNFPTRRWVHHEEGRWVSDMGTVLLWQDLIDPVLIRDGIEDGAS